MDFPTISTIDTLEEALNHIEAYSIRNIEFKGMPPIDWTRWRESIESFRQSFPPKDDIAILRQALDELNDGHSGIPNVEFPNPSIDNTPMPVGTMIGKTAYIRLPQCIRLHAEYKETAQNVVRELDMSRPNGWIVDLRINKGGNYIPMVEGIDSLLGNGTHAYMLYPLFKTEEAVTVNTSFPLNQPENPIAVLMGDMTNSSGELTLISFLKLKNVKTFGEPSAGNSSSNINFRFHDRVVANTVGLMADREKVPFGGKIYPDKPFTGGARPTEIESKTYDLAADPLVIHALQWIHPNIRPSHHPSPSPPAL